MRLVFLVAVVSWIAVAAAYSQVLGKHEPAAFASAGPPVHGLSDEGTLVGSGPAKVLARGTSPAGRSWQLEMRDSPAGRCVALNFPPQGEGNGSARPEACGLPDTDVTVLKIADEGVGEAYVIGDTEAAIRNVRVCPDAANCRTVPASDDTVMDRRAYVSVVQLSKRAIAAEARRTVSGNVSVTGLDASGGVAGRAALKPRR